MVTLPNDDQPAATQYGEEYHLKLAEGSRASAEEIVPLVLEAVPVGSAVDVGCGSGEWLAILLQHGVTDVLGIDGDYVDRTLLQFPEQRFRAADLAQPLALQRRFDLVLSLEVAEHLPPERAHGFVADLTALGPVILFSAAIPFQGGTQHLNEQWPDYWTALFDEHGYQVVDCLRARLWNNPKVDPWYAQNTVLFVQRSSLEEYPVLEKELSRAPPTPPRLIHPRINPKGSSVVDSIGLDRRDKRMADVRLEVTESITNLQLPPEVERVRCILSLEGEPLGPLELPVCDGVVTRYVLTDAIAAAYAWLILGRFLECMVYPYLEMARESSGIAVYRGTMRLDVVHESAIWCEVHDRVGWTIFLQELWGDPARSLAAFMSDTGGEEAAAMRVVDGEWPVIEISESLPELAAGGEPVEVVVALGGCPLGLVQVVPVEGRVSSHQLRAAILHACGFELCRVAVREGILQRPMSDPPARLRERLALAARSRALRPAEAPRAELSRPAGLLVGWSRGLDVVDLSSARAFLARRTPTTIGSSGSRRASLPSEATAVLEAAAAETGELLIRVPAGLTASPAQVWYVPEIIWRANGAGAAETRSLPNQGEAGGTRTGPYASGDTPDDGSETGAADSVFTDRLPILRYGCISPQASSSATASRTSPAALDAQLARLQQLGCHTIALHQWRRAMERRQPLGGRAVILSFDCGCRCFLQYAWPILSQYGLTATVTVVSDWIGATRGATAGLEDGTDILDWDELRWLRDRGVEFGSRSASHRRLTALSPREMVNEIARSRADLARGLGYPVDILAYPFGAEDEVVRHLAGACGYVLGLSLRSATSDFSNPMLSLPRLDAAAFATGNDSATNVFPTG